ncbi:MAG: DUF1732 domain-containing protein [Planctomycetes bacterium]|nr:DUF1732 domain-containing protein [Planctomycetota bacterium]
MTEGGRQPCRSMTAFASRSGSLGSRQVEISLRSVNHRHFQLRVLPCPGPEWEARLRGAVAARLVRGSAELRISFTGGGEEGDLFQELREWTARCWQENLPPPTWSDLFSRRHHQEGGEERFKSFLDGAGEGLIDMLALLLDDFDQRRMEEGDRTAAAIAAYLREIEGDVTGIKPHLQQERENKLRNFKEAIGNYARELEPGARGDLARECALLIDRLDVSEELQRIASHLQAFDHALHCEAKEGKYLDFLCQEIFREINTLGTKSLSASVSQTCADMKNTLEKIREQLQNLV